MWGIQGHPRIYFALWPQPMAPGYKRAVLACFFQLLVVGGNVLIWSDVVPKGSYAPNLKVDMEHLWIPWLVYICLLFCATMCTSLGTFLMRRTILFTVQVQHQSMTDQDTYRAGLSG